MLVYLARHAQSNANKNDIIQGQLDHPLSLEGLNQAHLLGKRIQCTEFKQIYTTHLIRAKTTAEIVVSYQKNPITLQIISQLSERNYGCWENMSYKEIAEKYPAIFNDWLINPASAIIPDAEPWEAFKKRVIIAFYKAINLGTEPLLFVVHGGTIINILADFLKVDDANIWKLKSSNTGLSLLEINCTRPRIIYLNDTNHLNG
jgi:phosphoserine phosphatase